MAAQDGPKLKPIPAKEKAEEEAKEGPKLKPIPQKPKPDEAASTSAVGSNGRNVSKEVPVKARRTEDPPLKDDKQYFIEPVLPNKIEHGLQEESRAMGEDSISFETRETNEEQLRETMDRVNIKTPNVVGSSTQPLEGVERVELVAGDNGKIEASKEEVVQKVTLKTRKEKGSENTKTASQKEEGIEKVTLKSTKQKENQKDICSEDLSSALLKPAGEKKVVNSD